MIIIGHRGCFYETENTIKSYLKAFELGADGIEVDIQKTLDDKLVISHDINLKRVFGIDFDIRKNDFNSLNKNNLKDKIPTLEEVLQLVRDKNKFVDIEIKNREDFRFVLDLIKKFNYENLIVSSFYHKEIYEFKKIYKDIKFAYLYVHVPKSIKEYLNEVNYLKPNINYLVSDYKNYYDRIIPWVVNEDNEIELIKLYNPLGVITDFPERFKNKKKIENKYIQYLLKLIVKEESFYRENEIVLTLVNSLTDFTIENIKIDEKRIVIDKNYPFIWKVNEKIKIKIDKFSILDKLRFNIKEIGTVEFYLKEFIEYLS
ncbi:MAG: glycerophosphodiester phosphodiesterase family protein [Caldisericia bacterium]|nr:glycerophosphodiester phosphodiesterase family protein [Caldisericia bacterium]